MAIDDDDSYVQWRLLRLIGIIWDVRGMQYSSVTTLVGTAMVFRSLKNLHILLNMDCWLLQIYLLTIFGNKIVSLR